MDVPTSSPTPPTPEPPRPLTQRRRSRDDMAVEGPDEEILALAGRLQALIGSRREEEKARRAGSPRENRLRPRLAAAPANPDEEILAVLAEVRAATAGRSRRYAQPDPAERLELLAGRWLRRALWPAACALAALLAFTLGRHGAAPAAEDPTTPAEAKALALTNSAPAAAPATPHWSVKSLPALDDVLTSRRAGDAAQAGAVARTLRTQGGALPGLDLFLAENFLHFNRPSEATGALLPLLRAEPPLAAAAARLGFIAARTRRLDDAASYLEMACLADPFRGDLFARWGEALRRQGKAAEAVTRFNQALLRPADDEGSRPAPPETAFYRRLAQLESGEIDPVRQETAAALAGPVTAETGRWLLTAAALELLDNHPAPAAALLAKARAALPAETWERFSGDLFFRNYAGRRELVEFLPPSGSAADTTRVNFLSALPNLDFVDP